MALLTELDKFLTREEAAPILEVAHEVIEKVKLKLGERFKAAVRDADWHNAVQIGDRIIGEFGSTRMAEEVSQMIELLRERALEQQGLGL